MAYGVSVESEFSYGWEDQSAIMVTISTELNIVICASEASPARYIDILHSQIESVGLEKRQIMSHSSSSVTRNLDVLVIGLKRSSDPTFYLGAGKRFAPLINLAFTSVGEATAIVKLLLECASHIVEKFTCSESEPLRLSQPLLKKHEGHDMGYNAAPKVDALPSRLITTATEFVSLPALDQGPKPDLTHSFLNWPKNVFTGPERAIDPNDQRSDTGISIEEHQTACPRPRCHSPMKNPEDFSEDAFRSSSEWRKGAMLIDTAPELQGAYNHTEEEKQISKESKSPAQPLFPERDGDYNSFYDATPRAHDANIKQEEQFGMHCARNIHLEKPMEIDNLEVQKVDANVEPETSRSTPGGVEKLLIQVSKKNEHIDKDIREAGKPTIVSKKRYTSRKRAVAINDFKRKAFGRIQADRKAGNLNVKVGRSHDEKKGGDEYDFPKSPGRALTAGNAQPSGPRMTQNIKGTVDLSTESKPPASRSIRPHNGNSLIINGTSQLKGSTVVTSKVPPSTVTFEVAKCESATVDWDEGLLDENKSIACEPNSRRNRPTRSKAKSAPKGARNRNNEACSSKKDIGKTKRKSAQKSTSAARPAPQPRVRRAAALVADERIKSSVKLDASQEQGRAHSSKVANPKSSREAISASNVSSTNHDTTLVGIQLPASLASPELFVNDNLDRDETCGIKAVSKAKQQHETCDLTSHLNDTSPRGNRGFHSTKFTQQYLLTNVINGQPDLGGKDQDSVAQTARPITITSSPEGSAYVKCKGDDKEQEGHGASSHRTFGLNDNYSLPSSIHPESLSFETPASSRSRVLNLARDIFSSDNIVFNQDTSVFRSNPHVKFTLGPSINEYSSSAKSRALVPENTYQKAEESLPPKADRAGTNTESKEGNSFAIKLRKALSGVKLLGEHYHAQRAHMQSKPEGQEMTYLETYVVPSLKPLAISPAKNYQAHHQNPALGNANLGEGASAVEPLGGPSSSPEKLSVNGPPSQPTYTRRRSNNLDIPVEAEDASPSRYSMDEVPIDERLRERRSQDFRVKHFQLKENPESLKSAAVPPVQLVHQTRRAIPHEPQRLNSAIVPAKPPRDVSRKPDSWKRKLSVWGEDPSDLEPDLVPGKRARIATHIPKVQHEAPRMDPKYRGSATKETARLPSSQSTRVNENGSPTPFIHSRHFGFPDHDATNIGNFPRTIPNDERGEFFTFGDKIDAEPSLLASETQLPKTTKPSWRNTSSSSKHKETLNNSKYPRTNQLTAHRVDPNGEFINVHTETVVLPIRPPDPFVKSKNLRENTFMKLLRRSGKTPVNFPKSDGPCFPKHDLDKTLTENILHPTSKDESWLESPFSKQRSSSEFSFSSEEGLQAENHLRKGLETHQRGQLNVLYNISHVSRWSRSCEPEANATSSASRGSIDQQRECDQ